MKNQLLKMAIILSAITIALCVSAAAADTGILGQIEVTDYDNDANYMQQISEALDDGSEYAYYVASIYEVQRNLKIDAENLDVEKTEFFSLGLSSDEIKEAVKEYMSPPYELTESERLTVEAAVMAEAGSESMEGKMMIAQCILDNALTRNCTVTQIIKDYQIVTSYYNINDECVEAVSSVFDIGLRVTEEKANIWYAPALVYSSWHESQIYVTTIGGHKFFRTWV